MSQFKAFREIFGRSLDDFWIDNASGFDHEKFDKEIAKSGKRSLLAAVRIQYGAEGVAVIKRLFPKRQC